MWRSFDQDNNLLDLEYLYQELDVFKEKLQLPYIDRRAREDDLNDDLLEEVKTAFEEISNKEKDLKQAVQVMEFLLK